MKRISTLAVAAIAALALTAALGSASAAASSTVLCKTNETSKCPSGDIYPAGSWVSSGGGAGDFSLKFTSGEVSCNFSVFASKTTAESGEPLPAVGQNVVDYCSYTSPKNPCSVSIPQTSNTLHAIIFGAGKIDIGTTAAPLTVNFECTVSGTTFQCTYAASSSPVTMTFGLVEGYWETHIEKAAMTKVSGGACIGKGELTFSGSVGNESPVYFRFL